MILMSHDDDRNETIRSLRWDEVSEGVVIVSYPAFLGVTPLDRDKRDPYIPATTPRLS